MTGTCARLAHRFEGRATACSRCWRSLLLRSSRVHRRAPTSRHRAADLRRARALQPRHRPARAASSACSSSWREAGIRGVLLTSRPNDGTRELLEKAPAEFKTVAFARPYVVDGGRADLVPRSRHLRHDRARARPRHLRRHRRVPHLRPRRRQRRLRPLRAARGAAQAVAARPLRRLRDRAHLRARPAGAGDLGAHRHEHARRRRSTSCSPAIRTCTASCPTAAASPTAASCPPSGARCSPSTRDRFLLGSDTWVPQRWPEVPDIMAGYRALARAAAAADRGTDRLAQRRALVLRRIATFAAAPLR